MPAKIFIISLPVYRQVPSFAKFLMSGSAGKESKSSQRTGGKTA